MLSGTSMRVLLPELLPQFEKSSGHRVTVEYGTLGAIADRVMKGEAADVVIVTDARTSNCRSKAGCSPAAKRDSPGSATVLS